MTEKRLNELRLYDGCGLTDIFDHYQGDDTPVPIMVKDNIPLKVGMFVKVITFDPLFVEVADDPYEVGADILQITSKEPYEPALISGEGC